MAPAPPPKQARTREEIEAEASLEDSPERVGERARRTARDRLGTAPEEPAPTRTEPGEASGPADTNEPTTSGAPSAPTTSPEGDLQRPRGGFRNINTIPENVVQTRATDTRDSKPIQVLANYIKLTPMADRQIFQYRVDFEPLVESKQLRRFLFRKGTENIFSKRPGFDGMHDIYCSQKLEDVVTTMNVDNPQEESAKIEMKITRVSDVKWGSLEMLRVYNLHMKNFLKALGFYQITSTGSWVNSALATPIGNGETLAMVRGFKTAANVFDTGDVLMNLEPVHKLMQRRNVLQIMGEIRQQRPHNLQEALRSELTGKLVVTNYNKRVYRIEDINFSLKPTCTFKDKRDQKDISYKEYFLTRFNESIRDDAQPLLLVIPSNKRKGEREQKDQGEIYLVPELCNIAGLTEQQRNDGKLKRDLIQSSQIHPNDRVQQMRTFLKKFHEEKDIRESLKGWGYSYETDAIKLTGHTLPRQTVGFGPKAQLPASQWAQVDANTADFKPNSLAVAPQMPRLAIMITRVDFNHKQEIMNRLRAGFQAVGLRAGSVRVFDINEGDAPNHYVNALRQLDSDVSAVLVIMNKQNKEKYDSIKKVASVERGLITQVVTAKLIMDDKKAKAAAGKIAIQLAAKVGGEPWRVQLPLGNSMVCGYDNYSDTAKRGRAFGAFMASMNDTYSSWFSKAATYDRLDQMSTDLESNLLEAISRYKGINQKIPDKIFIYRDGVSEGQITHVFEIEVAKIKKALKSVDERIKLTIILVNKRCGARFYMRMGDRFCNPPPGSVIDHTVTRQGRYDFYLISQSTRNGTVAPTYYNIIHDESGFAPQIHQKMAYKFCFLYYNWSGTVRVPAPCQYAKKLAQLCGENLHELPNESLNDRLHFL